MENVIEDCVSQRVWAVVGASTNPDRFGNKIFLDLSRAGYIVYGVNPGGGELDGQRLYVSLAELPQKPAVVDTVVPPEVTEQVVRLCAELGIARVWMQPGSESEKAIAYCEEQGIAVVHHACAMIRKRQWTKPEGHRER